MLRVTKTIENGIIAMRHINHQNNQLCSSKKIATKWGTSKRQVENNIMQMARYVTEGIIDAIE